MDALNRLNTTDFSSWEELNEYVGMNRSEPFKEYFAPMQITEEQKKRRGIFAERLEDDIVYLLAFLFYQRIGENQTLNIGDIIEDVRTGYINAYGTPDEYITARSEQFATQVIDVAERHGDDPYYVSADRARKLAEEEANTALNHAEYVAALKGYKRKQWVTMMDGRERQTHGEVNGTIIPIGDLFYVGDSIFAYPRDMTYDPSMEEVANCRCSLRYLK